MGVDLSRIEAWTREKLEAEAFKRGIRSPEFRTRAELMRLIVRDQYGGQLAAGRELIALGARSVATARSALSNALGAALAVLPEPLDTLARLRGKLPTERTPLRHGQRTPASPGAAAAPPATLRIDQTVTGVTAPDAVEPEVAAPQEAVASELDEAVTLEFTKGPAADSAASDAFDPVAEEATLETLAFDDRPTLRPPSVVPAGTFRPGSGNADGTFRVAPLPAPPSFSATGTRTFVEEPIRTVSMARLLAAQGHRERALAIYEELIAQNSEEASLHDEAEALRHGEPARVKPLSAPPEAGSEPEFPDDGDRLWCEGQPAQGLRLRWALSELGQQRARAVLGSDGELAIRVVSIAFDPIRVVRSEITEHGPIDASGEWTAPALTDSARCFAAVGLREGQRFVAVVHARPE